MKILKNELQNPLAKTAPINHATAHTLPNTENINALITLIMTSSFCSLIFSLRLYDTLVDELTLAYHMDIFYSYSPLLDFVECISFGFIKSDNIFIKELRDE